MLGALESAACARRAGRARRRRSRGEDGGGEMEGGGGTKLSVGKAVGQRSHMPLPHEDTASKAMAGWSLDPKVHGPWMTRWSESP